ncbi:PPOX class F420-dependent oxidoreductase [Rhodococcus sp. NPDC127528]|uniref:PPOX class F420-dependent oxidoreductase n=1 Tax=unclassified Rhodococcus (in: high G+C Gram-positive bacteria) TaxID=192944 RepID=UPI0036363F84
MADLIRSAVLPEAGAALIDAPEFATLATLEPSGQPQLSVIWVQRDGGDVLFSTVRGRRKAANLERDPRATLLVYPASRPYSYLEVRGSVAFTEDPDGSLIHTLATKYTGAARWEFDAPGTPRVIGRLTPDAVVFKA